MKKKQLDNDFIEQWNRLVENEKIIGWLEKHTDSEDELKSVLVGLHATINSTDPLSEWDSLPTKERRKTVDDISKLARKLSDKLRTLDQWYLPRTKVPPEVMSFWQSETGLRRRQIYMENFHLPTLLDQLATHIRSPELLRVTESRPQSNKATSPDARQVARRVTGYFEFRFKKQPWAVISEVVSAWSKEAHISEDEVRNLFRAR